MADIKETGVRLVVQNLSGFVRDIDKAQKSVAGLDKDVISLTKSLNLLDKAFTTTGKNASRLGTKLDGLESNFSRLENTTTLVNSSFTDVDTRARVTQNSFNRLSENVKDFNQELRDTQTEASTTTADLRRMGSTLDDINASRPNSEVGQLNRTLDNTKGATDRAKQGLRSFASELDEANRASLGFATSLGTNLVEGLGQVTLKVGEAIGASIQLSADFESAFAGVSKTVDGLAVVGADGFLELTEAGESLRDGLVDLSNTTPVVFEELAGIAELGGQLGITGVAKDFEEAQEILLSFTETTAGLAEATNLTQESAATSLAQFANIFQNQITDPVENFKTLGDVIVNLGNNAATTEKNIVSFASRVAGAGATVGLTQTEVLGLSTFFSSLGISAEAGGSQVSTALLKIQNAANGAETGFIDNTEAIGKWESKVSDGIGKLRQLEARAGITADDLLAQRQAWVDAGNSIETFGEQLGDTNRRNIISTVDNLKLAQEQLDGLRQSQGQPIPDVVLQQFLEVTGRTKEEFQALASENPMQLFQDLINGLAGAGDNASVVLNSLGLSGVRAQRVFLSAANSADLLGTTLQHAFDAENQTGALEGQSALTNELEQRYATLTSRIAIFQNQLRNTAEATIGQTFIPMVNELLAIGSNLIPVFGERLPDVFAGLQTALQPLGQLIGDTFTGLTGGLNAESLNAQFDSLISTLNTVDITPFTTSLTNGIQFVSDNWELLTSLLTNTAIVGAVSVTLGAISLGVSALLSPLGLVVAGVAGLTVAWETNFLGIQQIVGNLVEVYNGLPSLSEILYDESGNLDLGDNPVSNAIESLIAEVPQGIEQLKTTFGGITEAFTQLTENPAFDGLGDKLLVAGQAIAGFTAIAGGVAINNFIDTAVLIGEGITALISGADALLSGNLQGAAESLGDYVASLASIPASIVENIANLILPQDIDLVTPLKEAIGQAVGGITEDDFAGLKNAFTFELPELPPEALEALNLVKTTFNDLVLVNIEPLTEAIGGLLSTIGGFAQVDEDGRLAGLIDTLGTLGSAVLESLAPSEETLNLVGVALGGLATGASLLATVSIANFTDQITAAITVLDGFLQVVSGWLNDDDAGIQAGLDTIGEGITQSLISPIENLTGLFSNIDLGIPEFPDIAELANEAKESIVSAFTGLFTDIDLGFPDLPFVDDFLPDFTQPDIDILPDFEPQVDEAKDAGRNVVQGLQQGVEEEEPGFLASVAQTGEDALNTLYDIFDIRSPSEITRQMGLDLIAGLMLPFSGENLEALTQFSLEVLNQFQQLVETVETLVIPSHEQLNELLILMYTETYPLITSAIVDMVIPAKTQLSEVNDGLTLTVDSLNSSETVLASTLSGVVSDGFSKVTKLVKENRDESKALDPVLKALTKRYLALASAMERVAEAGGSISGVPAGPSGGAPPAFASGGSFIVPQRIPPELRGPTNGLIIEVHPRELIEITPPEQIQARSRTMTAQPASGGNITNQVTQSSDNSRADNRTMNLHVQQAVSGNIISSFDLLRSL